MDNPPLVGSCGIWYGYLTPATYPGDDMVHQVGLEGPGAYGNASLFAQISNGVSMTHRALVSVDVHGKCAHEVAIERDLMVQLDKGASGGLMERGESKFVAGSGNSHYQGILESGHAVRAAVSAPGDCVEILSGYISVVAQPV
jgi:hypothetical protein